MDQRLSLFSPEVYYAQLQRYRGKAAARRHQRELESQGVTLSMVSGREQELCRRLALDVRDGAHRWSPLARGEVFSAGKRRTIHRPELIDALVLGAMAQRLTALLEFVLSDHVCAYRPGRNPRLALTRLQNHLEAHRRTRPKLRERGVFVLQRDLSAYGESIPTHPGSALWPLVDGLLQRAPDPLERKIFRELLTGACRPSVRLSTGELFAMNHGLPTGSPIQQPLANLYLTPVDDAVSALAPELYVRFGDDLLLVDSRLELTEALAETLHTHVNRLGLQLNAAKTKNVWFTGPGCPLDRETVLPFRPSSHVEYLGARVSFEGRLGLKRKRLRALLTRSRWRAENAKQLAGADAVASVAGALRAALLENSVLSDPTREALRTWVDDRTQLRQLDRHLTQLCAEVISGVRGVKALRRVQAKQLRAAGLRSLLELRRRSAGAR